MQFLFSSFLILLLGACSHGTQSQNKNLTKYEHLVIVGTNDFHGYLQTREKDLSGSKLLSGGIEWFAGYMHILQKKYGDHLVLLDGGDLFQGTLESNTFLGEPVVAAYNLLPYRATAVGNHEFDYGPVKKGDEDRLGALKARMSEAHFPFLAANIYDKRTQKPWQEKNLYPSIMVQVGNLKLGIIGLTTVSSATKTIPQNIRNLEFGDLAEAAEREAKELRAAGANLVLITTHEGGEHQGEPVELLLRKLPVDTIDAVVSGHWHSEIHEFVHQVPVIQSRTQGLYFGRIDLYIDPSTQKVIPEHTIIHDMQPVCGNWLAGKDTCDLRNAKGIKQLPLREARYEGEIVVADAKVHDVLQPYFAKIENLKKELLGYAERNFEQLYDEESEVGEIFAKALQEKFPRTKAVYINGGGFRRYFLKGQITYGDLFEVHPFDNQIGEVKMSGKQFKELLKIGVSGAQMIPFVSGVEVVYHKNTAPIYQRDVNGDGKKEIWEQDRLVSASWENGKAIRDEEEFWVATNDYLVSGGDNGDQIFDKIPAEHKHFLELNMRDATADFLRAHKGIKLPIAVKEHFKTVP